MTFLRLMLRGLTHHWRINAAVALGVAAATAVLTGALVVGDSVRGSLRELTLDRLGNISHVLVVDRFFRSELVEELASQPGFSANFSSAAPGMLFSHATLEHRRNQQTLRASSVTVVGCDERFWQFDIRGVKPERMPGEDEIVLNQALADELRVRIGDEVTVRLPSATQVPADSPLADKNDRIRGLPGLKVVDIIPARGLGRFSLQASQTAAQNAFVSLSTLQSALGQDNQINAIFISERPRSPLTSGREPLARMLRPSLADLGINIKHVRHSYRNAEGADQVAHEYFTITTDRMIFSEEIAESLQQVLPPTRQPVLTYLANSISRVTRAEDASNHPGIPYSMVTAFDPTAEFQLTGPEGTPITSLENNAIVLNEWAAEDLQAQVGDTIRIQYFEPETTHGHTIERSADFRLAAITGLTKPVQPYRRNRPAEFDQPPTPATDPDLTPEVEGVTDQETIDDWDPPFPFEYRRVRNVDEEYWDYHRTTPKAFISLTAGQRLWGSRFGQVTSFRVPATEDLQGFTRQLEQKLATQADNFGFQFTPIRDLQLEASQGTTPFDVLFLSLSFFVIAAALLMVALLFRLGIEQRSSEVGTLLALGYRRRRVSWLLLSEGAIVAALGAAIGIAIGIGYARLMLAGLSHWWIGAITTPFLSFHFTPTSLVLGYLLGVLISAATIAWTIRQTKNVSVRRLLTGQTSDTGLGRRRLRQPWAVGVFLTTALVLAVFATRLGGMAQAGAFVGAGAALLTGSLLWIRRRLKRGGTVRPESWARGQILYRLATRSAARNPARSVITIGLMASATFLIVAMSSFRLAPTETGVGGFQLLGESSQPIYVDLNDPAQRAELFGSRATSLANTAILGLRVRAGDDASCNNLYQASQPRVLGVTARMIDYFSHRATVPFSWSDSAAQNADERANPWRLLSGPARELNEAVPVVLDKNTAMYSLHLYRGIGEEFEFNYDGQPIRFRVVGLLANSVLQGGLLIGEPDFRRRFPQVSGYRFFLIATPTGQAEATAQLLEERFGDEGLDIVSAKEVLAQLLAVQNTYLSTFQSLGALGLLLGTFGMATVQLRNVLERRGELALLRSAGYRRRRLAEMVLIENMVLLAGGLGTGVFAAIVAVLPHKLLGDDAVSWQMFRDLGIMLAAVLIAGLMSSFLSVRAVLRFPLLASLRGE